MTKVLNSFLAVVLCVSLVAMETACSVSSVSNTSGVVSLIESQLPGFLTQAASIATIGDSPQLAAIFTQFSSIASTDLPVIQTAVAAYQANKSNGTLVAIAAAVSALSGKLNAQVLAANKLVNTDKERLALAIITGVSLGISAWSLAISKTAGTKAARMAEPSGFREVLALASRSQIEQTARAYGLSADQLAGF